MVGERDVLAYHGKHARSVGRIETAMMEGGAVDLDAAYCSGSILKCSAEPTCQSGKGTGTFARIDHKQRRYGLCHEQSVPRVEQLVTSCFGRDASLLQCRPEDECREYVVAILRTPYSIAHEPCGVVHAANLIAVVMVGAHSAAEGESLIDGIVPNEEVIIGCLSRVIAIGVKSKTCKHVLNIIESYLAILAIEFIGGYNRSTGEAVAALAYIHFLECSVSFLYLFLWSYAHVESLSESLFNSCEVLLLVGCQLLGQRNVVLVLFPLPHTAPVPEVAIGQRIVAGHLKVGSGAVVYLLHWEGEAVEIYPTLALGSNDAVAGNVMVLLVALHVFEANPAGTPSGRIKAESKPIRYVAVGGVEFESQRVALLPLVVYP